MIQTGDGFSFCPKPLHEVRGCKSSRGQNLHRHGSIDLHLTRPIDDAHPAARHFLQQIVRSKRPGQGRLARGRLRRHIQRTAVEHGREQTFRAQPPG